MAPARRMRRAFLVVALAVGTILAVGGVLGFLTLETYRVLTPSMEPTFHCGELPECRGETSDRVLVSRLPYEFGRPHRGDVAAFEASAKAAAVCAAGVSPIFIARVVGLPGERIEERRGVVYVDGRRLEEPYRDPALSGGASSPPFEIPDAHYFVMGDARRYACDSRRHGAVPERAFIGKVIAIYWPPNRVGLP